MSSYEFSSNFKILTFLKDDVKKPPTQLVQWDIELLL